MASSEKQELKVSLSYAIIYIKFILLYGDESIQPNHDCYVNL